MTSLATAYPSTAEELHRKSMDTLMWLVKSMNEGQLTDNEYSLGIDTLFMAVSGLVNEEFIDLITEAEKLCAKHKQIVKRLFTHPDKNEIFRVTWRVGSTEVITVRLMNGVAEQAKIKSFDSAEEAAKLFRRVNTLFDSKGWIEL